MEIPDSIQEAATLVTMPEHAVAYFEGHLKEGAQVLIYMDHIVSLEVLYERINKNIDRSGGTIPMGARGHWIWRTHTGAIRWGTGYYLVGFTPQEKN